MKKGIVFTNGCFDILHKGHVDLLKFCEKISDKLIIGINSDNSIAKLKGKDRPYMNERERKDMIESIVESAEIYIFHEETPLELIKSLKPNIIVKGGDYQKSEVIGSEFVDEVIIFPIASGYSTTSIAKRIIKKNKNSPSKSNFINESISAIIDSQKNLIESSQRLANQIIETSKKGGKVIIFGNGGSASDAEHFSSELLIRYKSNRKSLGAISLNSMTSSLTACANDFSYEYIFTRQLEGLLDSNDIVIGISTSGKSPNVMSALNYSISKNNFMQTWLLTGDEIKSFKNINIFNAQTNNTPLVQQIHLILIHLVCEIIENKFDK